MNGQTWSKYTITPTDKGFVVVNQTKPITGEIALHVSQLSDFVAALYGAAETAAKLAELSSGRSHQEGSPS